MGIARCRALLPASLAPFVLAWLSGATVQGPTELRFAIHADPKTFDPLLATEEASETIRFLTGGVLIRFNRQSQQLEPELASSWKVLDHSRRIDFVLRPNVTFSNGAPFGPDDVVASVRRMMTPNLASGVADSFRAAGGEIRAERNGPYGVSVHFSSPVAGVEALFDELAISSARAGQPETAVLGPFMLQEHKGGQYVLLRRNPHYWKTAGGVHLPYLNGIRLEIQSNRETELIRFRRGELHLIDKLDPEAFDRMQKDSHSGALNAGPSLDSEFFWFNLREDAPLPAYKKRWFQSALFRRALSAAINRDDLVRLAYRGHANSAAGPVSPANRLWANPNLNPPAYQPQLALKLLKEDGFQWDGHLLRDRDGNAVEFSMITNAGSKTRMQMGTLLQQDLMKVGIRLNFLPVEFQSLIERITKTWQYEACLLGFSNTEIDPNGQMNVWMSSGTHHPWNPGEAKPVTAWEAEIDRLMRAQHTAGTRAARKSAYDRVQQIIVDQAPVIYLLHPAVLVAVSPALRNASPSALPKHLYWNAEFLSF